MPLSGSFRLEADDDMFELDGREDVFAAVTDVIYLPPRSTGELTAPDGGELAMATAPANQGHPPRRFDAAEIAIEIRGSGMAAAGEQPALRRRRPRRADNRCRGADTGRELVIVAASQARRWSDCEVPLEEIYYFRAQGEGGFGLHRTYTKDHTIDATVTVHDGDVFLIPRWLPRTLCGRTRTPSLLPQCDGRPRRRAGLEGMRRPGSCLGSRRGMELSPTPGSR